LQDERGKLIIPGRESQGHSDDFLLRADLSQRGRGSDVDCDERADKQLLGYCDFGGWLGVGGSGYWQRDSLFWPAAGGLRFNQPGGGLGERKGARGDLG
jgi:hypothetical protein